MASDWNSPSALCKVNNTELSFIWGPGWAHWWGQSIYCLFQGAKGKWVCIPRGEQQCNLALQGWAGVQENLGGMEILLELNPKES